MKCIVGVLIFAISWPLLGDSVNCDSDVCSSHQGANRQETEGKSFAGTAALSNYSVEIPDDLRVLLRCNDLCDMGPSVEDERLAASLSKYSRGGTESKAHAMHIRKTCMWRCRKGEKSFEEQKGVLALEEYRELPPRLKEYRLEAEKCVIARLCTLDELVAALDSCGVVHLQEGLVSTELLIEVRSAYEKLRSNSDEAMLRVDQRRLRSGREELWPPFVWPFNAPELISPANLVPLLQQYLGPNASLDHVTILNAPAETATEAQKIHADVNEVRRHLEIHMPLSDISLDMGPTMFCPASHGISQADELKRAYFSHVNCSYDKLLSYSLPLKCGEVTIYDANTFHAGTANVAGKDRPILQISWAADPRAVSTRRYAEKTFGGDAARWQRMSAEIEAFRAAASST